MYTPEVYHIATELLLQGSLKSKHKGFEDVLGLRGNLRIWRNFKVKGKCQSRTKPQGFKDMSGFEEITSFGESFSA